MLNITL